jgi:hypothetical protein
MIHASKTVEEEMGISYRALIKNKNKGIKKSNKMIPGNICILGKMEE